MNPRYFVIALSFLTRLGPSRIVAEADFPRTLSWFPAVGLVVGVLCVLPCWLGLFAGYAWIQGWVICGLGLWLTRGLHADGLADIADAWGSGTSGERFWIILKDSRAGPFGVLGLVMAVCGQLLAFGALSGEGRLGAVVWCFALGRLCALALLCLRRNLARPGLAALFASGAGWGMFTLTLAYTLAAGLALTSIRGMLLGVAGAGVAVCFLARLSGRQGGFNGDFLGASIVLGELAGALAALA